MQTRSTEAGAVNIRQWIACSEKLPMPSQYVIYRTPHYEALGKIESRRWYSQTAELEPENNPVLCWAPLS
jgi:hypothetical protein